MLSQRCVQLKVDEVVVTREMEVCKASEEAARKVAAERGAEAAAALERAHRAEAAAKASREELLDVRAADGSDSKLTAS